jgi:hypothetical protein
MNFPSAIFSNNPWKETALFTSAAGVAREIEGIFTKENTLSPIGSVLIQNDKPQFDCMSLDVPDANNECTLEIYSLFRNLLTEDGFKLLTESGLNLSLEGVYVYNIHEAKPTGEGITELVLSKS